MLIVRLLMEKLNLSRIVMRFASNALSSVKIMFFVSQYYTILRNNVLKTSRERHKSTRYLRLKNSKRTSKCQIFSFTVPKKPTSWTELARRGPASTGPLGAKRGIISDFSTLEFLKKMEKSQCRKKTGRGNLLGFFNIHSIAKHASV